MGLETCEHCYGAGAICLKCKRGWGDGKWSNQEHTSRRGLYCRNAIRRRDRALCPEHAESFYRCDGCGVTAAPGGYGGRPGGWGLMEPTATICGECVTRRAVAMDAVFENSLEMSKLGAQAVSNLAAALQRLDVAKLDDIQTTTLKTELRRALARIDRRALNLKEPEPKQATD